MQVDLREVYRYLGYGRQDADLATRELAQQCLWELERAARPRSFYREYALKLPGEDMVDASCFRTRSRHLAKNLQDCHSILVFGATIGSEADHLIQRYNKIQMSKAVIMQAAGAAMIEAYCDEINAQIRKEYEVQGLYLRPRFSPGYGDFDLSCQKPIFAALELNKRTGMALTDSLVMAPSKSVTAVMGVSRKPYRCEIQGCEVCKKADCIYRR